MSAIEYPRFQCAGINTFQAAQIHPDRGLVLKLHVDGQASKALDATCAAKVVFGKIATAVFRQPIFAADHPEAGRRYDLDDRAAPGAQRTIAAKRPGKVGIDFEPDCTAMAMA